MIENYANLHTHDTAQTQRVLKYVKNERMGGTIAKYETVKASDANIEQNIETSLYEVKDEAALAYQPIRAISQGKDQFGFGDLLDMVNPLQHIPVIGHFYREITGDQIKPISRVIGGAAFSGPIGVATALIDNVAIRETGNDITDNAFNLAFGPKANQSPLTPHQNKPSESAIEIALKKTSDSQTAQTLLAFSDLSAQHTPDNKTTPQKHKSGLYALGA